MVPFHLGKTVHRDIELLEVRDKPDGSRRIKQLPAPDRVALQINSASEGLGLAEF
jgi:hypothetical protein